MSKLTIDIDNSEPSGGRPIYNITWPVKFIPKGTINGVYNYMHDLGEFGPLKQPVIGDLKAKYGLNKDALTLIHRIICAQKALEARPKINEIIRNILPQYEHTNIDELSKQHHVPPLMLLRSILIEKGYSPTALYHIYTRRSAPEKYLSGRDLKQFYTAIENDVTDIQSQQDAGKRAEAAEMTFIENIRGLKIGFKTQEELSNEQKVEFGRPIMTPDVLFTETVYINGKRVHWIDFKSYTLLPNTFIFSSLLKQARKYNKKFGSGAFVFLHGTPHVNIPNTLLLTTDALYALKNPGA